LTGDFRRSLTTYNGKWKGEKYNEENHYHNRSVSDGIQYDGDGEVHKALSATSKEKVLRKWMRPE
jgi:hypothetical protein